MIKKLSTLGQANNSRGDSLKKSTYLGLFGAIFAIGIVIGFILFINTDDGEATGETIGTQALYHQEGEQVLGEPEEVVLTAVNP